MKHVLYREDVALASCGVAGCEDRHELTLLQRCHTGAGLHVVALPDLGALEIRCRECGSAFAVAVLAPRPGLSV